jgi:hypothetical protein
VESLVTTSKSPLSKLKAQADTIARVIKAVERREPIDIQYAAFVVKIREARDSKTNLKVAVVMDDKTLIVDMPWSVIADSTETSISEYVLAYMCDELAN